MKRVGSALSVIALTPSDIANTWNGFFSDWVKPILQFGTPALIVFGVLLVVARILTRALVRVNAKGQRSAGRWSRLGMGLTYWLGVGCLLWASVEAAIMFPLGVAMTPTLASWSARVSILLGSAGLALVLILFTVIGTFPTGLTEVYLDLSLVAGTLILIGMMGESRDRPWLDGHPAQAIFALVLAVLGILIVGRARGIGIGLFIQGSDKTGADDAGLGAFVRARLYMLGGSGPSGIEFTQHTDVSTLPGDTLALIPEGVLAKLASLFLSLFKTATPWGVEVSEQPDGSIIVCVKRNGKIAEAEVLRARTLWLPEQQQGQDATPDWSTELRSATAAFVLLTLSRRYAHVEAGLAGATNWRSVALQVIATDQACRLSQQDKKDLLVRAEAVDSKNRAVQLARIFMSYRSAADRAETKRFADQLSDMLVSILADINRKPRGNQGLRPLELRLRYNLLATWANYAAFISLPGHRECSKNAPDGSDEALARDAILAAGNQAVELLALWRTKAIQKACPGLRQEMECAVTFAAWAITVDWSRRFIDEFPLKGIDSADPIELGGNITLLARYEHACGLVPRIPEEQHPAECYSRVLDELEMAVADRASRIWARSDPSFALFHDVDEIESSLSGASRAMDAANLAERFKGLVGNPVPSDFLTLSPLAGHRDALEKCGVNSADDLSQAEPAGLIADLGIGRGEAARLLRLAHLYLQIRGDMPPDSAHAVNREQRATALVHLLLAANLDSTTAVREAAKLPDDELKQRLINQARPWAVAAPGRDAIGCWLALPDSCRSQGWKEQTQRLGLRC